MPITCTRNASTSRWRRSTRPASFSPAAVSRTPLYGSYSASPDSASAFTIVVAGLDVTLRMIELARQKRTPQTRGAAGVQFLQGDMAALPFPAASFDIVTTGYGLRNVPDLNAAIDEIARVLAPGGQILSLDFNRP